MDPKNEFLPRSAFALYVKLYCKRKEKCKTMYPNYLTEATKSWVSLSEQEKQEFTRKYEDYKTKYRNKFACYLKNAQLYMKNKGTAQDTGTALNQEKSENLGAVENRPHDNDTSILESFRDTSHAEMNILENQLECEERSSTHLLEPIPSSRMDKSDMETDIPENEPEERASTPLPEPLPPSVKNGQELFEIVKSLDSEKQNSLWVSLSNLEKSRYSKAVLNIKKEYIKKYKEYLESLQSKDLFEHYIRKS